MIRSLVPLGLMHVHELLDDEVKALAGERYSRKDELERGRRHGSNPGTVGLGGQRVPIRVPRVRSIEGGEIPLRCYEAVSHGGEVNDLLLKRVLYGISCRNYEAAAEAIPGAIGLSSSTVSRVRSKSGEEASLPHFEAFREEDPLPERVLNQILVGVSTRNYESSLDKPAAKLKSRGTSKSAASRHLVSQTTQKLEEYLSRRLESFELAALMMDGLEVVLFITLIRNPPR